jgi:Cd2+/Zn2+-exporting ATPase
MTATSGLAVLAAAHVSRIGGPEWSSWVLYGLAAAAGGTDLFPKALRGLQCLRLDIYVLMALAVFGAALLGQWDEAATVAFLFGLAERIEELSCVAALAPRT